jgi:hypothetical protein
MIVEKIFITFDYGFNTINVVALRRANRRELISAYTAALKMTEQIRVSLKAQINQ